MRDRIIYLVVGLVLAAVSTIFFLFNKTDPSTENTATSNHAETNVKSLNVVAASLQGAGAPFDDFDAQRLQEFLGKGVALSLIDVREPSEFSEGHIPGSKNLPLGQLVDRLGELPKDQSFVMICRSGNRSGKAKEILRNAGYREVHNLTGGMLNWSGSVEKE